MCIRDSSKALNVSSMGGVVVSNKREREGSESSAPASKQSALVHWRKYGQKHVKGPQNPCGATIRSYYKCTHPGCQVRKKCEVLVHSKEVLNSTITGVHNHALEQRVVTHGPTEDVVCVVNEPKLPPEIDVNFVEMMMGSHPHFVVCDPNSPDCPIVFTSAGFMNLTGYTLAETVGRNCRFIQGKDTNPLVVAQLKTALREQKEIHAVILNYKKDGTPFWNLLHMSPIITPNGQLHSYVGSQLDVSNAVVGNTGQMVLDMTQEGPFQTRALANNAGLQ
eukprot:TRINITY_DN10538_c0_g1_i1.p1 TRINITY_DN10538_c0_g1~~TRINITY_DN10538_c0_g1_i1.p1  ORF type:complete len:278 (-),score=64.25 TRINITY_DN10538_c0_g1_i1:224-1057(-)